MTDFVQSFTQWEKDWEHCISPDLHNTPTDEFMGSPVSHRQAEDVYSFMMATLTLTVKPIYPLIVCLMNYLGLVEHYMNKKY